jgi:hypothetical protein
MATNPREARLADLNRLTLAPVVATYQHAFAAVQTWLDAVKSNVEHGLGDHLPSATGDFVAKARMDTLVNEVLPTLRAIAKQNHDQVVTEEE